VRIPRIAHGLCILELNQIEVYTSFHHLARPGHF
jgi:hypothetical protein